MEIDVKNLLKDLIWVFVGMFFFSLVFGYKDIAVLIMISILVLVYYLSKMK